MSIVVQHICQYFDMYIQIYTKKKGEGGDEKYKDLGLVDFIYFFFSLSVC